MTKGVPVSYVDEEIASQPACWARAIDLAAHCAVRLPERGERVAVIGCGTSWFMAMAYAQLREGSGQGETDAYAASEFPAGRRYDRVVAITRSGTTTEVLSALAATDARTTVVLGDPDTPAHGLADEVAAPGATFVHSGQWDPLADLVVAQRFAAAVAAVRALDPDRPRHLTRSVILS